MCFIIGCSVKLIWFQYFFDPHFQYLWILYPFLLFHIDLLLISTFLWCKGLQCCWIWLFICCKTVGLPRNTYICCKTVGLPRNTYSKNQNYEFCSLISSRRMNLSSFLVVVAVVIQSILCFLHLILILVGRSSSLSTPTGTLDPRANAPLAYVVFSCSSATVTGLCPTVLVGV